MESEKNLLLDRRITRIRDPGEVVDEPPSKWRGRWWKCHPY